MSCCIIVLRATLSNLPILDINTQRFLTLRNSPFAFSQRPSITFIITSLIYKTISRSPPRTHKARTNNLRETSRGQELPFWNNVRSLGLFFFIHFQFSGRSSPIGILFFADRSPPGRTRERALLVRTIDNQWVELSITAALARTKLTKPMRCY